MYYLILGILLGGLVIGGVGLFVMWFEDKYNNTQIKF